MKRSKIPGMEFFLFKGQYFFIFCFLILVVLLFKNPFSGTNLISNLEPQPDSVHYLTPARNIISVKGFYLSYQGRNISPEVPPLYSAALAPLIWLFTDPRAFYLLNALLSLLSLFIFYRLICSLNFSPLIKNYALFTFTLNPLLYWYPSFVMAENLLLPLFLLSFYMFLLPPSKKYAVLSGVLAAGMFATKYVAGFLSVSFLLVYFIKIISSKNTNFSKAVLITFLLTSFMGIFLIHANIEKTFKQVSLIESILDNFKSLFINFLYLFSSETKPVALEAKSQFSSNYVISNLWQYIAGFLGGKVRTIGTDMIFIPAVTGMVSLVALILNPFFSRFRLLSAYFLLSLGLTLSLILTFRVTEARYLFSFVPALIIAVCILISTIEGRLEKMNKSYWIKFIVLIFLGSTLLSYLSPLKTQFFENFIRDKSPYSYEAVMQLNNYFPENNSAQKPVVIFPLSPYFVEFYSNSNYELLPASKDQHFMTNPLAAWGQADYKNLPKLYAQLLDQGRDLFISDFGTHFSDRVAAITFARDFNSVRENFTLQKVAAGCNGLCNLYKIQPK